MRFSPIYLKKNDLFIYLLRADVVQGVRDAAVELLHTLVAVHAEVNNFCIFSLKKKKKKKSTNI